MPSGWSSGTPRLTSADPKHEALPPALDARGTPPAQDPHSCQRHRPRDTRSLLSRLCGSPRQAGLPRRRLGASGKRRSRCSGPLAVLRESGSGPERRRGPIGRLARPQGTRQLGGATKTKAVARRRDRGSLSLGGGGSRPPSGAPAIASGGRAQRRNRAPTIYRGAS